MEILHINRQSFQQLTSRPEGMVLVDFWAEWCQPCLMLGAVLEELAVAHPQLTVAKVDIMADQELAVELGIDSIPALFFYRDGKLEKRLVGYMTRQRLEEELGL